MVSAGFFIEAGMNMKPVLIIHGGAGRLVVQKNQDNIQQALKKIYEKSFTYLKSHSALEVVVYAVKLLEDCHFFNAGTGSKLQRDGKARMSASVMDGKYQKFSAVLNIENVKNPVEVATHLLHGHDSVLACHFATQFAREKGFSPYNPVTAQRKKEWQEKRKELPYGTVGAVARDWQGHLAAATSTGGKGFERLGRVSDSSMPAGNYANHKAAVSCTGIGEHIIDEALASKIVVRVTDGLSLKQAFQKSFKEVTKNKHQIGAIGVDRKGIVCLAHSTPMMYAAYLNKQGKLIVLP